MPTDIKTIFLFNFRPPTKLYRRQPSGQPDIAANWQKYPPTKSGNKAVERNQLN